MSGPSIALLILAGVLVVLASVCAAVDAALVTVSRARVEELRRDRVPGAAVLALVVADKPRHASLLLLLRVGCELFAAVLVAVVLESVFAADWAAIAVAGAVMTIVSYILIGVGPRTIGRQHPYPVALRTASVTHGLAVVLGPLASMLILIGNAITPGKGFRDGPFSTEIELRELVDLAEARGVVEAGERNMIHSVFELGDTIVREVMVPRPDVLWIEAGKTVLPALALALRSGFSRIPVIGENVDDIVGVVYLKDLARRAQGNGDAKTTKVEEIMRPPSFVPESKPVDVLLREMQARRIHMAVVIDEYGGTAGVVTIEDILEEIVGEIADEYDDYERPAIEPLADGAVRVVARLPVEALGDLFNLELTDDDDIETVGGLLARELGRVPIPGAKATVLALRSGEGAVRGLVLEAESAGGRRNRIDSVLVRPLHDGEPAVAGTTGEDAEHDTVGADRGHRG